MSLQTSARLNFLLATSIGFATVAGAQSAKTASALPAPLTLTAEQDQQNMMDQLGIKALRPGPSGDESAPNHANYDESKANPYPNLPEVLTLKDGRKVTTAGMWWKQRRPEIVEDFEREVYGRIELLGARGLSAKGVTVSNDYRTEKMPPVKEGLLDGELAWRQHDGGHTDAPNVRYFLQWADPKIGNNPATR